MRYILVFLIILMPGCAAMEATYYYAQCGFERRCA